MAWACFLMGFAAGGLFLFVLGVASERNRIREETQ